MFRIGIDLGGTKIEGVALDAAGQICVRRRVATPGGDYAATIRAIADLVRALEAEIGTTARVGIGMPGAISKRTGRVKNANSTCLNGQPLQQDIEVLLARPVRLANDANCFALSEAVDGSAQGLETVFGVIIGTGTGGGIVRNGSVFTGLNAIAGEWGHNPLPWPSGPEEIPGVPCYCGRTGCIETYLSGPGLAADHRRHTGASLPGREIVAAADRGDAGAALTMARYVDRMARGLAHVINLIDPDAIVLGGGLSQISRLYAEVPARWGRYVFSDHVATQLLAPVHGDASGVRGAAWLWPRD
jgi:fructokinase